MRQEASIFFILAWTLPLVAGLLLRFPDKEPGHGLKSAFLSNLADSLISTRNNILARLIYAYLGSFLCLLVLVVAIGLFELIRR